MEIQLFQSKDVQCFTQSSSQFSSKVARVDIFSRFCLGQFRIKERKYFCVELIEDFFVGVQAKEQNLRSECQER